MTDQNAPLILVVDDYQDAREMYAEYLQYSGFRVAEARNGNACRFGIVRFDPASLPRTARCSFERFPGCS